MKMPTRYYKKKKKSFKNRLCERYQNLSEEERTKSKSIANDNYKIAIKAKVS